MSGAKGYVVQYATNKKFKKAKTLKITTTSKLIKGLTKNKTYYVRVRAYKKFSKKTVYTKYSAVKSVKIKK